MHVIFTTQYLLLTLNILFLFNILMYHIFHSFSLSPLPPLLTHAISCFRLRIMFVGEFLLPQVSQNITSILILLIFVGDFFDSLLQKESATEKHYESGWHFNSPVAKGTKWWSSTLGGPPKNRQIH